MNENLTAVAVTAPAIPHVRNCSCLTGYWINKTTGQFRCYSCGFQQNIQAVPADAARQLDDFDETPA